MLCLMELFTNGPFSNMAILTESQKLEIEKRENPAHLLAHAELFYYGMLPRALFSIGLKGLSNGASTPSLRRLFYSQIQLNIKKFFLIHCLKFCFLNSISLLLVLLLDSLVRKQTGG